MTIPSIKRALPLRCFTPDTWGNMVLSDICALLSDHAHLERKAAANALEMIPCWPEPKAPERWIEILSAVALDESQHLMIVNRLLKKRGGAMVRGHRNPYAQGLRALIRNGKGRLQIVDRLMVSSLIEARSCERFEILSRVAEDKILQKLYRSLWASEHGHFKVFLELAGEVVSRREVEKRWDFMLDQEAKIIQAQPKYVGMHSWVG